MGKNTILSIILIIIAIAVILYLASLGNKNNQNILENKTEIQKNQIQIKMPIATIKTNLGDIKIELFEKDSPKTTANFIKLSKDGFYDTTRFHRVIKDFMIQGGDPNSKDSDWSNDGLGGPGYVFEDEINPNKLVGGVIAMANSGPNTNGSQFFIITAQSTPWLDGKHTAFGRVISGMDVVSKIENLKTYANDNPQGQAIIEKIIIE